MNEPAQIVFWIVDDDIKDAVVIGPFDDCLGAFTKDLSGTECNPQRLNQLDVEHLGPLAGAVNWMKVYRLPAGAKGLPVYCTRPVDILVYGIYTWDPLEDFLRQTRGYLAKLSVWPHLVFTDLHKGDRKVLTTREEVENLPGVKLALLCDSKGIPCIPLTSETTTIENFECLHGRRNVFPVPRDQIRPRGKVFDTLKHRISGDLFRRLWIPEFKLTVEGHLNADIQRYRVTFKKNGHIVSHVPNVTPTSYNFLYLWAYASRLARLKGWDHEIARWADSVCPAVSNPPSNKDGGNKYQVHVVWPQLFNPIYWNQCRHEIFFGNGTKLRRYSVLNANISHLDTPTDPLVPACWNHPEVIEKLVSSLPEILPPDGMQWLFALNRSASLAVANQA